MSNRKTGLVVYAFIDSQNLNLGVAHDASNQKSLFVNDKKTRSSGRITSLGQPGHRDVSSVAKTQKKVKTERAGK